MNDVNALGADSGLIDKNPDTDGVGLLQDFAVIGINMNGRGKAICVHALDEKKIAAPEPSATRRVSSRRCLVPLIVTASGNIAQPLIAREHVFTSK